MRPDELSLEEQLIASIAIANHRKGQNPMEKVTFETNIPQTIALKSATGKRVESRFNEYEVYYQTTEGRPLYASPALDAKITAFEPAAGVPFSVCKCEVKDGQRKRIEWQVLPVTKAPAVATPAPSSAVATPNTPAQSNHLPQTQHTTAAAAAPIAPAGTMTQLFGGALLASIDAFVCAREYAKTKGLALEFNEEDIRAGASSIFIAMENRLRYGYSAAPAPAARVNGGATWQQ